VTETRRIVIVSNRLPVSIVVTDDGKIAFKRSSGGLVNGLDAVHKGGNSLWLGSLAGQTGVTGTREVPDDRVAEMRGEGLCAVDIPGPLYQRYYDGFSNGAIWPLFHYMPERARFDRDDWRAYQEVNERFAAAVEAEIEEGDFVWIHDYQLMLLPEMLRRRRRDLAIGFFLHIPFPAADVFRIMPWRRELLAGLLGADLIGFHTLEYMRHFSNACARIVGLEPYMDSLQYGRRSVRMGAFPLGVDVDKINADARSPACEKHLASLEQSYAGKRLVLGVDRLDYTKGIPQRLEAFSALLERNPDLVGSVSLLQVSVPSRVKVEEYQEIKSQIDELVGQINGRFGMPGYVPIHYLFRTLTREHLYALYRRADICLVTPIRDGLNLVSKEYVAAKGKGQDPGVLILSEFAGSAAEMGEAMLVNPWSVDSVVEGLERALAMPESRKLQLMADLFDRIRRHDNRGWSAEFLGALTEMHKLNQGSGYASVVEPDTAELTRRLQQCRRAFFFLDYDGTLVPLADKPELATPDEDTLQLLRDMSSIPNFYVAVASGRDRAFLERYLPADLTLICEHGACLREPGKEEPVKLVDATTQEELWQTVVDVMEDFESRIPGSRIEHKEFGVVWHYRMAEPIFAQEQARELAETLGGLLQRTALGVTTAKKAVEVRHVGVNKGDAVRHILHEKGFDAKHDVLVTVGDDRTDEDMFRVWPKDNISISVSDLPMSASYIIEREALVALLEDLTRSAKGWQYKLWET